MDLKQIFETERKMLEAAEAAYPVLAKFLGCRGLELVIQPIGMKPVGKIISTSAPTSAPTPVQNATPSPAPPQEPKKVAEMPAPSPKSFSAPPRILKTGDDLNNHFHGSKEEELVYKIRQLDWRIKGQVQEVRKLLVSVIRSGSMNQEQYGTVLLALRNAVKNDTYLIDGVNDLRKLFSLVPQGLLSSYVYVTGGMLDILIKKLAMLEGDIDTSVMGEILDLLDALAELQGRVCAPTPKMRSRLEDLISVIGKFPRTEKVLQELRGVVGAPKKVEAEEPPMVKADASPDLPEEEGGNNPPIDGVSGIPPAHMVDFGSPSETVN